MLNLKQKSYSHLLYRNGIVFALFLKKEMSHLKIKIGKIPNQNQQKSWTTLFFIFFGIFGSECDFYEGYVIGIARSSFFVY